MKSPRDILLERHQAAETRLDALRQAVLNNELGEGKTREAEATPGQGWLAVTGLQVLWRELVWPCRRAWIGLAAAWILIAVLHTPMEPSRPVTASAGWAGSPEVMTQIQAQWRLRAELLGTVPAERIDLVPVAPAPRSERLPASRHIRHTGWRGSGHYLQRV